ncbi:NAD-binding protein [Phellopilus nigrolimitatus]|nr:NAD-binding protein [Phellopilus nigrolimitatus]
MPPQSYLESLFSLEGKIAVLTGGTRGIGQSLALALASAGADIVLIQRDESNQETAEQIRDASVGRRAWIVTCDLSSKEQVGELVKRITAPESEDGLGLNIDVLVNCGGIQRRHPAELFPDDDWQEVLQVNLSTVWTLARDVGHHMLERRENSIDGDMSLPRGKIINIASLLSYQGDSSSGGFTVPAYAAAKHGVLGTTKALSNEWSSKGINVNCIAPGYIDTDMNTALINNPTRARQIMERIPAGRWGAPADFAGAAIFLASSASDYVCGETLTIDGGWMGR